MFIKFVNPNYNYDYNKDTQQTPQQTPQQTNSDTQSVVEPTNASEQVDQLIETIEVDNATLNQIMNLKRNAMLEQQKEMDLRNKMYEKALAEQQAEMQLLNGTDNNLENMCDQLSAGSNVNNRKKMSLEEQARQAPTINALLRLTPNQREKLCYDMYKQAKKTIKQIAPDLTDINQMNSLVSKEADRLIQVYIETN